MKHVDQKLIKDVEDAKHFIKLWMPNEKSLGRFNEDKNFVEDSYF